MMMEQIDHDLLQKICNKVDLLKYASQIFDFKKFGADEFFTRCPLHVDNTPSLSITPSKNLWYCHSCKQGGGILNFMMTYEHMTFKQALEKIVRITNSNLNSFQICSAMAFFQNLRDCAKNKKREADVSERTIMSINSYNERFTDEIPQEWLDEGIDENVLRKYEIRIDKASNRIVYPVYDNHFNLIGVKGRTRFKNYKDLHLPKYMNYYHIGDLDFFTGMKQAICDVQTKNEIIIVEGLKSVMKLDGWGVHNAVSAETSVINDFQTRLLLSMGIQNVVIAFDKDVKLIKIKEKVRDLKRFTNVFAVIDKHKLLDDKMSPCDKGEEVWRKLYKERVRI